MMAPRLCFSVWQGLQAACVAAFATFAGSCVLSFGLLTYVTVTA